MSHPSVMIAAETALLVVDVQEKLLAKIPRAGALVDNIAFLVKAANLLGVEVYATEQYPKGLGPTVPELVTLVQERPSKIAFSCCIIAPLKEQLRSKRYVLLAGIESHVCILQTAMDLLSYGSMTVYIAVDSVASRGALDHQTALRRLENAGAVLTTAETALFEWLGGADHPQFKQASGLVQERMRATSAE